MPPIAPAAARTDDSSPTSAATAKPPTSPAILAGIRLATVAEVPTPWVCLQHDLRLTGVDPATVDRTSGPSMAENAQTLRDGHREAVPVIASDSVAWLHDAMRAAKMLSRDIHFSEVVDASVAREAMNIR